MNGKINNVKNDIGISQKKFSQLSFTPCYTRCAITRFLPTHAWAPIVTVLPLFQKKPLPLSSTPCGGGVYGGSGGRGRPTGALTMASKKKERLCGIFSHFSAFCAQLPLTVALCTAGSYLAALRSENSSSCFLFFTFSQVMMGDKLCESSKFIMIKKTVLRSQLVVICEGF